MRKNLKIMTLNEEYLVEFITQRAALKATKYSQLVSENVVSTCLMELIYYCIFIAEKI